MLEKAEIRNEVIRYVVNQWIIGNGLICGVMYNTGTLAAYLGCELTDINKHLIKDGMTKMFVTPEEKKEFTEQMMGSIAAYMIEDRMEAASQLELMKRAQGGKYTPFISAEVRQTMDLKMKATNNLQTMLRTMMGGGGSGSPFIFNQQINTGEAQAELPEEEKPITLKEALSLIQENDNSPIFDTVQILDGLEGKYNFDTLPEVCAIQQGDFDASKEGLDIENSKRELAQITDNYKYHRENSEEVLDLHETRREDEYDIETEIDPEFS